MRSSNKGLALAVLAAVLGAHQEAPRAAELLPVDAIIAGTGAPQPAASAPVAEPADAVRLLRDIEAFRRGSAQRSPEQAAADWLGLWDRAQALPPKSAQQNAEAYDAELQEPVGLRSVVAALPAPAGWTAIRRQAEARARAKPDDLSGIGLRLLTQALAGDAQAMRLSLADAERLARAGNPAQRDIKILQIDRLRRLVYQIHGKRSEIAEAFRSDVEAQMRQPMGSVSVPDLVGLVGAERAQALLAETLTRAVTIIRIEGHETRALARRLALSRIQTLRRPQWRLIDTTGTAALYEAMQLRFDPGAANAKPAGRQPTADDEVASAFVDYQRRSADLYYFIDLVIAGKQAQAERAMVRATADGMGFSSAKDVMVELADKGRSEAVHAYLGQLLERRPQLQAWDLYLDLAGRLGRANEAIDRLDRLLKRPGPSGYLRVSLLVSRVDALLAADRVDEAVAGLRALLERAPSLEDPGLRERTDAAVRLAGLGRVLNQPSWEDEGLAFAGQALALPTDGKDRSRASRLVKLLAELRRGQRIVEAQALALGELGRIDAGRQPLEKLAPSEARLTVLTELAGLYDAAGRHADVQRMLDEIGNWGVRDLRAIAARRDSLGTPLGLMAARAMQAGGRPEQARAAVLSVLDSLPAHDPAYRMLVEMGPEQALDELDRRYAWDQFEERPLIWKAAALLKGRQYEAAETSARRAIAIDPSDGEQGPPDRMRAYAVLADVLEARGDAKSAQDYRRAVSAIRLSEQADELRRLGLLKRAAGIYEAALGEFSDAYCIQSRLAVQLGRLGLREESLKHYRRAFELMPDSFGRVESHCFGCENVFDGTRAQEIAEEVFTSLIQRGSTKPQVPYMLGYLRMQQGRYGEAATFFRQVVALDADYLNAWKHLHELARQTYIDARERDAARLRLHELDPRRLHVNYELDEVGDLAALWNALASTDAKSAQGAGGRTVYPLARSIKEREAGLSQFSPELRLQVQHYLDMQEEAFSPGSRAALGPGLAGHELLLGALRLMGEPGADGYDD